MKDINVDLHQQFKNLLITRLEIQVFIQEQESLRIDRWSMNYTISSLENTKKQNIFLF